MVMYEDNKARLRKSAGEAVETMLLHCGVSMRHGDRRPRPRLGSLWVIQPAAQRGLFLAGEFDVDSIGHGYGPRAGSPVDGDA